MPSSPTIPLVHLVQLQICNVICNQYGNFPTFPQNVFIAGVLHNPDHPSCIIVPHSGFLIASL